VSGKAKRPDFKKAGGLIPAIAQDAATGEILMMAYMSEDALDKTIEPARFITGAGPVRSFGTRGGRRGMYKK
jgi:phosphoribosyl-AMP cyclohydrolase